MSHRFILWFLSSFVAVVLTLTVPGVYQLQLGFGKRVVLCSDDTPVVKATPTGNQTLKKIIGWV